MQAVQMSSRLARGLTSKALVKPQSFTPVLTRSLNILTEEQKKKRDAYREKMQYPDDTPVYLRGGAFDRFLFGTSVVLVSIGTLWTIVRVYQRAQA